MIPLVFGAIALIAMLAATGDSVNPSAKALLRVVGVVFAVLSFATLLGGGA